MPRWTLALLLAIIMVSAAAQTARAFGPSPSAEYEIKFPGDNFMPIYAMDEQDQLAAASVGWQRFTQSMAPNWRAFLWNEATGVPDFAAGAPISMLPAGTYDQAQVSARSQDFLGTVQDLVRVSPEDLRFESLLVLGDGAYVHFQQYYHDLPVFFGLLSLHLDHGSVNAISAEVCPNITLDTTPTLSAAQAAERARVYMPWNAETDGVRETTLGILPVILGKLVTPYLVYRVHFDTRSPRGDWEAYVDAQDGEVYWRYDLNNYYTITGDDRGDVQERRADDPWSDYPAPYQRITADGHVAYSDEDGAFSVTVTNNQVYTVTATNRGTYAKVYDAALSRYATTTASGSPSSPAHLYWTDATSTGAERDAFHHVNRVHSWLKSIDPAFTGMDYELYTVVNDYSCTCNAWSGGGGLNFCAEGAGCNNMAQVADVVYHEYHHSVTSATYSPSAPPGASGMNEGFSDCCAMMITNTYCMAQSYLQSNPDGCMRTGLNLRQYPGTECSGEEHCLGEILMGGFWKVRRNLLAKHGTGFETQVALYFRSAVEAKTYNMPNFAMRFMMANDDNGDLTDGCPDYWEICDGWTENGIPCPTITKKLVFSHTPLSDQPNTGSPVVVNANITATTGAGTVLPESTKVCYSYDGINFTKVLMTNLGSGNYRASIPLIDGVVVDYYLRSVTTTGITGTSPDRAPEKYTHQFLAGPTTDMLNDNLESDLGWTLGAPDDDATDGLWERVDPIGKQYNSEWVQPENDHTSSGVRCFVTNGLGGFYSNYDVDAGKTSAISPLFDLSSSGAGFIEFYSFFSQFGPINNDSLALYMSTDGVTWVPIWEIHGADHNVSTYEYQKIYFRPQTVGGYTDQVRFKFVAEDNENDTITEAAVDDILIRVGAGSSAVDGPDAVLAFRAEPAAPSPFSGATTVRFQLPDRQRVALRVFDAAGRLVRTIADETLDAGPHALSWDGRTEAGSPAPSGIYYATLRAGASEARSKIVLAR
jgi:hypothetical protein